MLQFFKQQLILNIFIHQFLRTDNSMAIFDLLDWSTITYK